MPSCLLPSEQEFRREIFRRDTADRPEALVQGRVTDEAGHRVEGAKIGVWFQGTAMLDEVSGKDGSYHLRLRAGPWSYSVRVSHAGLATDVADLRIDKAGTTVRNFRLAPENLIRGRVLGSKGEPIRGATIHAVRNPDDPVASGEATSGDDGTFSLGGLDAKRYFLRASKFGWLPETLKWPVTAPATRIGFRLARTGVIEGRVVDGDGEGQPNATVVALLSAGLGATASPIIWTVDGNGKFAQDRFQPGHLLPVGAPRRDAGLPAGEDRDQRRESRRPDRPAPRPQGGARPRTGRRASGGRRSSPRRAPCLFGRSPLALPRKAVGEIDRDGKFVVGTLLPGRYEISVRVGSRVRTIRAARARWRSRSSPAPPSISRRPSSSARRPRSRAPRR